MNDRSQPVPALYQRMQQFNLTAEKIASALPTGLVAETLLLYTSHLEGLGTDRSDIDCYVIFDPARQSNREWEGALPTFLYVESAELDVEFYTVQEICALYRYLEEQNPTRGTDPRRLELPKLKLLHRFLVAVPILGAERWLEICGAQQIEWTRMAQRLNEALSALYCMLADDKLDDAVRFAETADWESACMQARLALVQAVLGYMAAAGARVVKEKWLWRQWQLRFGVTHPATAGIRAVLIDGCDGTGELERDAERLITFCQHMIAEAQMLL